MDEDDLTLALRLAGIADELTMRQFHSDHASHSRKADGGVVTEADTAVERALRKELARCRPDDVVYGEEFGGSTTGDRVWMLDPIDGTAWFVEGSDGWATLIGLVVDRLPTVGVVSRPAASTRWWAAKGQGAYCNGTPIRVSSASALAAAVVSDDFRSSAFRHLSSNPIAELASMGAAVRPWRDKFILMDVAAGIVDVAVHWWAWSGPDLASHVCILDEAGGRFSDLDGKLNLNADVHVASNGLVHEESLAVLRAAIRRERLDVSTQPDEDLPAIRAARAAHGADSWQPTQTALDR